MPGGPAERLRPMRDLLRSPGRRRNERDDDQFRLVCASALRPDSCCIDIGAHEGAMLRHITDVAPDGQHIAYEPLPDYAARLREQFPGVDVRQAAVSNTTGQQTFTHVRDDPALSGIGKREWHSNAETITVEVHTLDTALPEGYTPALIKLDVEGLEAYVLDGARETIRRAHPLIAFEHANADASREIFDLLCGDNGYRMFDMDGRGPLSWETFRDDVASNRRWNFLAV